MTELNDVPYKSVNVGDHSCGHDCHAAVMLG
jgi:metal-dependent amidase/aminoacylase/carboxypeptidase family protein